MIDVKKFGKDHWSLLAYLGYLSLNRLDIDRIKMRCNENKHPLLNSKPSNMLWDDKYSTKLKTLETLTGHDDWDCLDDLNSCGLIDIISLINGMFSLTKKGNDYLKQLKIYKNNGGNFNNFIFKDEEMLNNKLFSQYLTTKNKFWVLENYPPDKFHHLINIFIKDKKRITNDSIRLAKIIQSTVDVKVFPIIYSRKTSQYQKDAGYWSWFMYTEHMEEVGCQSNVRECLKISNFIKAPSYYLCGNTSVELWVEELNL